MKECELDRDKTYLFHGEWGSEKNAVIFRTISRNRRGALIKSLKNNHCAESSPSLLSAAVMIKFKDRRERWLCAGNSRKCNE